MTSQPPHRKTPPTAAQLAQRLLEPDVGPGLTQLLQLMGAQAVGLWRSDHESLLLVGFLAHRSLPREVTMDFTVATRAVPLTETGLGIVKAALTQRPSIAERDPKATGLLASASWLSRFQAAMSLAWPICYAEHCHGVIAIATPDLVTPQTRRWAYLGDVAQHLAEQAWQRADE